ncbi:hypothetical protein HK405_006032, partial [Cladochytrium tenue]
MLTWLSDEDLGVRDATHDDPSTASASSAAKPTATMKTASRRMPPPPSPPPQQLSDRLFCDLDSALDDDVVAASHPAADHVVSETPSPPPPRGFFVRNPDLWAKHTRRRRAFWPAADIDPADGADALRLLPPPGAAAVAATAAEGRARAVMLHCVAALAAVDRGLGRDEAGAVARLLDEVEMQVPEARAIFAFERAQRGVHIELFSRALRALEPDDERRAFVLEAAVE